MPGSDMHELPLHVTRGMPRALASRTLSTPTSTKHPKSTTLRTVPSTSIPVTPARMEQGVEVSVNLVLS